MAYSTTLDQKRREILRRQLYGKEVITSKKGSGTKAPGAGKKESGTFSLSNSASASGVTHESMVYLSRDLTKIVIFSALAIGAQILLLLAINNHLVKLPI